MAKRWAMRLLPFAFTLLLASCGGDDGGSSPAPPPPSPTPPPAPDPVDPGVRAARDLILADGCFRAGGQGCAWTEQAWTPSDFSMSRSTGEAILVIDQFPTLPSQTFRYRNRIKAYYRPAANGEFEPGASRWRLPTSLVQALNRFSGPDHMPAWRLAALRPAIQTAYPGLALDSVGHGALVLSLIMDTNPHQPLVVMDGMDLARLAPADYCDVSGAAQAQARLEGTANRAANRLAAVIRTENVRFINLSGGHTLAGLRGDWSGTCAGAPPSDAVLAQKLAAYAPLYRVLFGTPGVVTAHAAGEGSLSSGTPYDYVSAEYPNRLRAGFFTSLASGLDAAGQGNTTTLEGWPSPEAVDVYLNTGILPVRPFDHNRTPLLQIDELGISHMPVTRATTSWIAPLLLARMINLRHGRFEGRAMDDALVADVLDAVVPRQCPGKPGERCRYQDPLLHGQLEAVRLGYQPREYDGG